MNCRILLASQVQEAHRHQEDDQGVSWSPTTRPLQHRLQQPRPAQHTLQRPLRLVLPPRWQELCRNRSPIGLSTTRCTYRNEARGRQRSINYGLIYSQSAFPGSIDQEEKALTDARRRRHIIRELRSCCDGCPSASLHDNGHGVTPVAARQPAEMGRAGLVVGVALAQRGGAVRPVGEVGVDVGEGEVDVGNVGDCDCGWFWRGSGALGDGAGADGAGEGVSASK